MVVLPSSRRRAVREQAIRGCSVLVAGVYLSDVEHLALEITKEMRHSKLAKVTIAWAAVGTSGADPRLADCTTVVRHERTDKFELVNLVLAGFDLDDFDVLIVTDDDVDLAPGWLDDYVGYQMATGLSLAQPARTPDSDISHTITVQVATDEARRTRFVEVGPVFSLDRMAMKLLTPFDEAWPMGWGLDVEWSHTMAEASLPMGIIDATPVVHNFRKSAAHYDWKVTDAAMKALLTERGLGGLPETMEVLDIYSKGSWRNR